MEDWRSTGDLILATFSSRMAQRTNGVTKHRTARTMHSAHSAHRTTSRHEWRVTGRFAPSSVRPIVRIQRFMLIQLKPKHVFRCDAWCGFVTPKNEWYMELSSKKRAVLCNGYEMSWTQHN